MLASAVEVAEAEPSYEVGMAASVVEEGEGQVYTAAVLVL